MIVGDTTTNRIALLREGVLVLPQPFNVSCRWIHLHRKNELISRGMMEMRYLVEEKELGVFFLGEGIELGSSAVCKELPQPAGGGDFHIHIVAMKLPVLLKCSY